MIFPPITITDSTPFDFRWSDYLTGQGDIGTLEVWVDTPGDNAYYGDVGGKTFTVASYSSPPATGSNQLTFDRSLVQPGAVAGWSDIKPGYVFSCSEDPADDGNYVVAVEKNYVLMRNVFSIVMQDFTITLAPPTLSAANGQPLVAGTGKSFVTSRDNRFLNEALRFVVDTGDTATLRLRFTRN